MSIPNSINNDNTVGWNYILDAAHRVVLFLEQACGRLLVFRGGHVDERCSKAGALLGSKDLAGHK